MNPEIKPQPHIPENPPLKKPEIIPNPDKNKPYQPQPEIKPNQNPEVKPLKG